MKQSLLLLTGIFCSLFALQAQNYPNILNYSLNGTPVNGVKIKTSLPFTNGTQMPTISIEGYSYGTKVVIDLKIAYYIFNGDFVNYSITSSGSYTPQVFLSNENNKVVIFINDKVYFQRFTVSAFAYHMGETATWFQGWTAADEALNGTPTKELKYKNSFGNVIFVNDNVGIGISNPQEKLSVNGNIRAKEIKVETANWPDYVFDSSYILSPLSRIESYIKRNGHLPDVPTEKEVNANGLNVGENQALLLKKIEELTLYIIQQQKQLEEQGKAIRDLKRKVDFTDR